METIRLMNKNGKISHIKAEVTRYIDNSGKQSHKANGGGKSYVVVAHDVEGTIYGLQSLRGNVPALDGVAAFIW